MCETGPLQTRVVKEAMICSYNLPLDESLRFEREIADRILVTEDFVKGTRVFVEKRKLQWKGK